MSTTFDAVQIHQNQLAALGVYWRQDVSAMQVAVDYTGDMHPGDDLCQSHCRPAYCPRPLLALFKLLGMPLVSLHGVRNFDGCKPFAALVSPGGNYLWGRYALVAKISTNPGFLCGVVEPQ